MESLRKVLGVAGDARKRPLDTATTGEDTEDRLRNINDELRGQAEDSSSPWLPLESNPELFTSFAHAIGLPKAWEWIDVFGLDTDLLSLVPSPCIAVILLFPCSSNIYQERARQNRYYNFKDNSEWIKNCFFLRQHAEFGNACGTIASIHALANSRWAFESVEKGSSSSSALKSFCEEHSHTTADERGRSLLNSKELKFASDIAASSEEAQTILPDRNGPDLDHHFAAFVFAPIYSKRTKNHADEHSSERNRNEIRGNTEGRLLELDGTKQGPIDHGPTSQASFLECVADTIQLRFMGVDPESIEFSLMALCKTASTAE